MEAFRGSELWSLRCLAVGSNLKNARRHTRRHERSANVTLQRLRTQGWLRNPVLYYLHPSNRVTKALVCSSRNLKGMRDCHGC